MKDDRVCKICDGGPGNECACSCPDGPHYEPIYFYREMNSVWTNELLSISMQRYIVVKFTPRGCWIVPDWIDEKTAYYHKLFKFILDGKGKRYAYPTREEARASYIIRKQHEIHHCGQRLERAKRYLKLAETGLFGEPHEALHELHSRDRFTIEVPKAKEF